MIEDKKELLMLFLTFLKISPVTFGGGYAFIPLIEREVSEKNKWVSKNEIAELLALSQVAPGSIAVNSATFVGYKLFGLQGAIVATLGVVIPPFFIVLLFSVLALGYQDQPVVKAAFLGIRPMIVALIFYAAYKLGKEVIKDKTAILLTIIPIILLLSFGVNPVLILLLGAIVGVLLKARSGLNHLKDHDINM